MTVAEAIDELEQNTKGVRFSRLLKICTAMFGEPRIKGGHHIFTTGRADFPIVNLQRATGGKAKPYQVSQVLAVLTAMAAG
jgi:hypothetical protein